MFFRYLITEILKLRRSLALLLCLAAPAFVPILTALMALDRGTGGDWTRFAQTNAALWAFAMLPLSVIALSVLMAQMEHGSKSWNHLLALPGARPHLYLAKALVMMGLVTFMSALLLGYIVLAVGVLGTVQPGLLTGDAAIGETASLLAKMVAASSLVSMLQLWAALRFRSFVPPLVFGIGGTFVAIAATSARQGIYFPWLLGVNVLSMPDRAAAAIRLGAIGGIVVLAMMLVDCSRREA